MPPNLGYQMSDAERERIMQVGLPINDETILMGSDTSEAFGHASIMGNNFSISVNTDPDDECTRIFHELVEEGRVTMPLGKTFWGAYFGMLTDRFGVQWMVNSALKPNE